MGLRGPGEATPFVAVDKPRTEVPAIPVTGPTYPAVVTMTVDPASLALAGASTLLAEHVRGLAKDSKRTTKMDRVISLKRAELAAIDGHGDVDPGVMLDDAVSGWEREAKRRLLVDLAFSSPFAPYSLKVDQDDVLHGLRPLARRIGEPTSIIDEIVAARKSALRSQHRRNWGRVGAIALLTAAALGTAGWMAAPAIGTAIGTSAGLTGAAATAHGLALLGGGSLAAGGAGMAGGMWLVAATGATVGVVGGGGSTLLYQLGASEVRNELIKLQVTFRVAILVGQADVAHAATVIADLRRTQQELRNALDVERDLNDENSERVKSLEEKLLAIGRSIAWMDQQREEMTDGYATA